MRKKINQVLLHYLGTLHHQFFKLLVNTNIKQIFRTFNIASNLFWEKIGILKKKINYYQNGKGTQIIIFLKIPTS